MSKIQTLLQQMDKSLQEAYIDIKSGLSTIQLELTKEEDGSKYYLSILAYGDWWDEEFTSEEDLNKFLEEEYHLTKEQIKELKDKAITLDDKGDLEEELQIMKSAVTDTEEVINSLKLSEEDLKDLTKIYTDARIGILKKLQEFRDKYQK